MNLRISRPSSRWRQLTARATALAVSSALLAPGAAAYANANATSTAAAKTATSASASPLGLTEDQAILRARSTGKPVQATAATTDSSTLTANPDGTLTLTQNLAPVRKRVQGKWQNLDATLVRKADGTIAPKVTTSALTLSSGGTSTPLATMRAGSGSLAVSLPTGFTLGTPTLSGATATYQSVLPGVDLTVTAQDTGGFSEVLVVKNATAAANPKLAALTLATKASGVTMTTDTAGDLSAKDRNGHTVFSATAPTMWDSTAAAASTPKATDPSTGQQVDRRNGSPIASSAVQPGTAAHKASLKASYRAGKISLTPDHTILTGKKTVYPVYIDPSFTASGQTDTVQAWAFADSLWPSTAFWKPAASTPGPLHVGYTDWTSDISTNRSFFQTSVHSSVWGATVISSNISFYENWSASCTAEAVDLYQTGTISSSTTWNNQPSWISKLGTDTVANGWSTSCGPGDIGYSITSTMQSAANGHWGNVTFGLRAADESNDLAWKQFSKQATITTTYDHTPNTPSSLTTSPATSCAASTPTTLGLGDVTLRAHVSDPDGTISPLTANLTLKNMSSGTTYTQAINATSGTTVSAYYSHTTSSGAFQALTAKTEFAWYLTVTDQKLTSSQSTTCHFYYDPTGPGAPTIAPVTSTTSQCPDLTASPSGDALCTVGTAAGFTLTDTDTTSAAPTSYRYQLNGGNPVSVSASSTSPYTATISLKPTTQTDILTVTGVAADGNIGDSADYRFVAQAPATAVSDDLNGDGKADLLTVGGQNSLPAGLWQATGSGAGKVNATARNVGIDGNGVSTTTNATSFTSTQAITGHFFTGAGFNDVLDYSYNAATGAVSGELLRGQGDGTALNPVDSYPVTNAAGVFAQNTSTTNADGTTTNTTAYATSIASGGGLYNYVANGNLASAMTGYPDLLMVLNGSLVDEGSNDGKGNYPGADAATDLTDYNPYCLAQNAANSNTACTTGWSGWTITSTLINGLPALFARDTSTSDTSAGQLWYLSPTDLQTLTTDALSNGAVDTANTAVEAATSGWDSATVPTLQAADINGDGTPDLWTVSASGTETAHLMTLSTATPPTATWTTPTAQTLSTDTHDWPLNDYDTTALTADDAASSALPLTGTSGITAPTGGLFDPDVALTASNSDYLHTSSKALDLTGSFTVSLWVNPTINTASVLSQNGSADSGISIAATTSGWSFALNTGAGTAWSFDSIAGGTVHLGTWAHLTATYDKTTAVMNLYVDDVLVASGNHTAPSTGATGALLLGADWHNSARADYLTGELARLQTWTGAAVAPAQPYTPASYHQAITPTRILDTRSSTALAYTSGITAGTSTVTGGTVVPVKIAGDTVTPSTSGSPTTIPSTVTAVAIAVTATHQTAEGYVTTYADGTQRPLTSSTNFASGVTATGYQIVPVGNDGKIDLYAYTASTGTMALIVDVTGYFTSDATLTGDQTYTPLTTATRALDTRSSYANTSLTATGTVAANTSFTLKITSLDGVPSTATAVAVNLTTTGETGTGYLSAYATGATPSADTSLTYNTGTSLASMAADTPIGTGGTITIYNGSSATAVIVDIAGYYTTGTTGQTYHAVNPTRLVDTRTGAGTGTTAAAITTGGAFTVSTSDTQQITYTTTPTLVTMLTVADTATAGYITAYPTGTTAPATSNVDFSAGDDIADLALTPTDSSSQITVVNHSTGAINLVIDSSGYFD
ncbi:beta strand repeat-containing protein [Streptacidiphilus sp. EB103A]|uniref:beta strand repeat-containing protein n=1 Tax=Streptacidiphilus sp. EB103A TaxID=3156275 RepID=UPI0035136AEA